MNRDQNNQTDDVYTDEQLETMRSKTFNPELSRLINSITGNTKDDSSKEIVVDTTEHSLLKRINMLMYRLYGSACGMGSLELPKDGFDTYTLFEYELQRLEIDHYALFSYSEDDECFVAAYSQFIDKKFIGIYSKELLAAVSEKFSVDSQYVYISLSSCFKRDLPKLFANTLLPVFVCEKKIWVDSLYERLVTETSLPAVLLSIAKEQLKQEKNRELIRHKVHAELIRLQHNYLLIQGSVCYVVVHRCESQKKAVEEFTKVAEELENELGATGFCYRLNETTCIVFLQKEDIHSVHNQFLKLKEEYPALLLHDLEDYRGKSFLSTVYSIAYGKHK